MPSGVYPCMAEGRRRQMNWRTRASESTHPSLSLFLHLQNEKDNGKGDRLRAKQPGTQLVFMIQILVANSENIRFQRKVKISRFS